MPDEGELFTPETLRRLDQDIPPDEQPAGITAVGKLRVYNFQTNGLELFVDEHNHLCVKFPDGSVAYIVMSTIPPDEHAQIIAPNYDGERVIKSPSVKPELVRIAETKLLWDHLEEDE
jgi:hypothetical protein